MKKLTKTLLVTFMLLFTVSVNSQTQITYGGSGSEDFDTTQFVLDSDYGEFEVFPANGTFVQLYGNLLEDDSLTFTCPKDLSDLSEIELEFDKSGDFDVNIMYTVNGNSYNEQMLNPNDPKFYNYSPQEQGDFTNIKISFVVNSDINGVAHDINYIKFTYNEDVTSVDRNSLEGSFDIYSYSNIVNVKTNEFKNYSLQVYSLRGQLVLSENISGNFKTNLPESGCYIVKLRTEDGVLTKKVFAQ